MPIRLTLILLVAYNIILAQEWRTENIGLQIGLSSSIGSHKSQVGVKIQGFYMHDFVQVNGGVFYHFNGLHLGNRKQFHAVRANLGAVLMAGKKDAIPHFIYDGLIHQSNRRYALAYNYLWYLDNAGTSQLSGGLGFHFRQLALFVENDFFAGQGKDRFRTNDAKITYHTERLNFRFQTKLWTGETEGAKIIDGNPRIKDLSDNYLGKTSHGIISLGLDYYLFAGNVLNVDTGVDHEQVRDMLQNKFMHNKKFIPKKWRTPNAHYPMLDRFGYPMFSSSQQLRPLFFYFQTGINGSLFY